MPCYAKTFYSVQTTDILQHQPLHPPLVRSPPGPSPPACKSLKPLPSYHGLSSFVPYHIHLYPVRIHSNKSRSTSHFPSLLLPVSPSHCLPSPPSMTSEPFTSAQLTQAPPLINHSPPFKPSATANTCASTSRPKLTDPSLVLSQNHHTFFPFR